MDTPTVTAESIAIVTPATVSPEKDAPTQPVLQPAAVAPAPPQDLVVTFDTRHGPHPELNENGVPLPRVRRSAVAEAHRRALERREAERETAQVRRAAVAPVPMTVGTPAIAPARSPFGPPPTSAPMQATPPPASPIPAASEPLRRFTLSSEASELHNRETLPLPSRPVEERPRATAPTLPTRTTSVVMPSRVMTDPAEVEQRPAARVAPTPTPVRSESRYWDQPVPGPRFSRLRPEPAEPAAEPPPLAVTQPVPRPHEVDDAPTAPPRRTIRPLGATPMAETQPVAPPPAVEEPRPAMQRLPRPQPAAPALPLAPPEVAPRHVDDVLLEQLAVEWRTQTLGTLAGQCCGTCRYFQTNDGQRGTCACQFTQCHRQPVGAPDLGCLSGLGAWWAPTDEGWLQRAEPRRPRRATPLLDALEREVMLAEQASSRGRERRRNVR
jgi:hypothetical protein